MLITTFRKLSSVIAFIAFSSLSLSALAIPIANNDERTLPLNGAELIIDVIDNDATTDGDPTTVLSVLAVTQPLDSATGAVIGTTAVGEGNEITYTLPIDFDGEAESVSFQYTLSDGVDTDTATVTVLLAGPFTAFAAGSTDLNLATTLESICDEFLDLSLGELTTGQVQLQAQCVILEAIAGNNPDDPDLLSAIVEQIAPEETVAQTRIAIDNNRTQIQTVAQRVQQQALARNGSGTRNLMSLNGRSYANTPEMSLAPGAGDQDWGERPRWGVFANAQVDSAERDKTDLENGYNSDTQGIILGADYFLNNNTLVGSTIGYNESNLAYLNSDGELDAKITTLSIFSAYFLDKFSFYVQGSYGWLDYGSQRNIRYGSGDINVDETITSATGGTQTGFNSRADWQWQRNALTLTPYARLDYLITDVNAYEEVGSSGLEMAIGEQKSSQLTAALGLQGSYVLNMSWGVLTPNLELTYLSETNSKRDPITARFAVDTDPSRTYSIENDGGDSSFYQLTAGASAIFPGGISAFFSYTGFFAYENLNASQIQLGVRREF